jgi:hypothetical protein
MIDPDRELLARVYHDTEAAAKAAKQLWPDAPPAVQREAAADVMVHVRELRRNGNGSTPAAAPAEHSPVCECGAIMGPVQKKNPKMPDWRCPKCDKALWNRDRKRRLPTT